MIRTKSTTLDAIEQAAVTIRVIERESDNSPRRNDTKSRERKEEPNSYFSDSDFAVITRRKRKHAICSLDDQFENRPEPVGTEHVRQQQSSYCSTKTSSNP